MLFSRSVVETYFDEAQNCWVAKLAGLSCYADKPCDAYKALAEKVLALSAPRLTLVANVR